MTSINVEIERKKTEGIPLTSFPTEDQQIYNNLILSGSNTTSPNIISSTTTEAAMPFFDIPAFTDVNHDLHVVKNNNGNKMDGEEFKQEIFSPLMNSSSKISVPMSPLLSENASSSSTSMLTDSFLNYSAVNSLQSTPISSSYSAASLNPSLSSSNVAHVPSVSNPNPNVVLPAFLTKTFEIFSREEYSDICSWNDAGDTIIIKRPSQFTDEILPQYFKHQNFPSFIRQLNMYGFHKSVLDSNRREFQHPFFKRNRKDLLALIKRKANASCANSNSNTNDAALMKYEMHRESSDALLEELRLLRQRSDTLENRLRHVELDTAVVRNENSKLWSSLEASKMRQLSMQNKLKKILWILFEVFRAHGMTKAGITMGANTDTAIITDEFAATSRLPDFHEILRYLDMDDPPLIRNEDGQDGSTSYKESDDSSSASIDEHRAMKKRKVAEVLKLPPSILSPSPRTDISSDMRPPPPSSDISSTENVLANVNDSVPSFNNSEKLEKKESTLSSVETPSVTSALSLFSPLISEQFIDKELDSSPPLQSLKSETSEASKTSRTSETLPSEKVSKCAKEALNKRAEEELKSMNDMSLYNLETEEVRIDKLIPYKHVMQKLEDFECDLLDVYDAETLDCLLTSHISS